MTNYHRIQTVRGFTFIELAVVLSIVAVCTAIVFPKLDRLLVRESEPWKSGRRFVRIARHAHEFAVATESVLFLHVDEKAGKYWVSGRDADSGRDSGMSHSSLRGWLGDDVSMSHIELSEDDAAPQDNLYIRFSPDGWSDPATVTFTSVDGMSVTAVIGEWFGDIELVSAHSAG